MYYVLPYFEAAKSNHSSSSQEVYAPSRSHSLTHLFLQALVLPGPLRVKHEVASVEALLLALPLELAHVVRRHPRLKLLSVVETRLPMSMSRKSHHITSHPRHTFQQHTLIVSKSTIRQELNTRTQTPTKEAVDNKKQKNKKQKTKWHQASR